jgi:hypothetical protein
MVGVWVDAWARQSADDRLHRAGSPALIVHARAGDAGRVCHSSGSPWPPANQAGHEIGADWAGAAVTVPGGGGVGQGMGQGEEESYCSNLTINNNVTIRLEVTSRGFTSG